MSIETGIWFFFIYALFGYIVEVIYCSIGEKRVVNRGFLHGPYLPIYGFGALLILICFSSLYDRPLLLFVCSMVATTALEYLTSFILEQLFQSKLWDYSKRKINLHGRVCLLNSFLFGILALLLTYGIHPLIISLVRTIPHTLITYGSMIIVLIISIDTTYSTLKLSAFQKLLSQFTKKAKEVELYLKELSTLPSSQRVQSLKAMVIKELEELKEVLDHSAKRFLSVFPTITSGNEEKKALYDLLKERFNERRNKLKEKFRKKERED